MKSVENRLSSIVLICALIVTTFGVTPFFSFDPINIFKFSSLSVFGACAIALLIIYRKQIMLGSVKLVIAISTLFFVWIGSGFTSIIGIRS